MKKIKETYLLFIIIMGLISLSLYSTYALFTASSTIEDVVGFTAELTTNSNIIEYERVVVPAGETKIIELNIKNNYGSTLYYGVWYEIASSIDFSNLNIGVYTKKNSTPSSGQITNGVTKNLLIGITNGGAEEAVVNVGTIGSFTSNLNLNENRNLLPIGWLPPDFTFLNYTVNEKIQATFPKGGYTVNTNCTDATTTFDYEKWGFRVSSLSTSGTAICSPILTTKTTQYLNTYIKDILTGTEQGTGQVVNENGYRYEGEDPNNYIKFNNELWRIIGVFETEVVNENNTTETKYLTKIIRNDSIGGFVWDAYNVNIWPSSSLYNILNNYYYSSSNGTDSGYCYKYMAITGNCNFINSGIKEIYRPMVEKVTWYLGGYSSAGATADNFYTYERSTDDTYYYPNNKSYKTTTAYIGLMYASDYGYSVLASTGCPRTTNLGSYDQDACAGKTWMYKEGIEWTITPSSSDAFYSFNVNFPGYLYNNYSATGFATRPVLYLDSSVYILSGNGSESMPYIIAM